MDDALLQVRIRAVESDDLPTLFEHQLDPAANRLAKFVPRSAGDFETHWAKILANSQVHVRAILVDEVLAGYVSCFTINEQHHVGYWIGRAFWGRGIATRSLELLLEELTIRPIHARVAVENIASMRVLEKCGFVETGREWSPATGLFMGCEEAFYELTV